MHITKAKKSYVEMYVDNCYTERENILKEMKQLNDSIKVMSTEIESYEDKGVCTDNLVRIRKARIDKVSELHNKLIDKGF